MDTSARQHSHPRHSAVWGMIRQQWSTWAFIGLISAAYWLDPPGRSIAAKILATAVAVAIAMLLGLIMSANRLEQPFAILRSAVACAAVFAVCGGTSTLLSMFDLRTPWERKRLAEDRVLEMERLRWPEVYRSWRTLCTAGGPITDEHAIGMLGAPTNQVAPSMYKDPHDLNWSSGEKGFRSGTLGVGIKFKDGLAFQCYETGLN